MSTSRADLAGRLLDAQVAWVLGQLEGPALTVLVEREVDDLFETGSRLRVRDLASPDEVAATLRRSVTAAAGAAAIADLAVEVPARVRALPENSEHRLGDLVPRADVEELVAAILDLDRVHERTLDRLTRSPLVGVVASAFVTRLVSDVMAQNTEFARKMPGMTSLLAFGGSAVGRVKGLADRQLDGVLGDAMGKGGEFAVRRVNAALLAVLRTGPVRGAAMEGWDLEAGEPISRLVVDVSESAVRRLAESVRRLVAAAADTAYAAVVIEAAAEVLFERYGEQDVSSFLEAAGVTREDLVAAIERHARTVLAVLGESGDLERGVRDRLAPFYSSDEVRELLDPRPRRAPRRAEEPASPPAPVRPRSNRPAGGRRASSTGPGDGQSE